MHFNFAFDFSPPGHRKEKAWAVKKRVESGQNSILLFVHNFHRYFIGSVSFSEFFHCSRPVYVWKLFGEIKALANCKFLPFKHSSRIAGHLFAVLIEAPTKNDGGWRWK
jgi:hypothetical protein